MTQRYLIGVDVSKGKVDCALINEQIEPLLEKEVINTDHKLERYFKSVFKQFNTSPEGLLVCCENTGIYSNPLKRVCRNLGINLWVEHALKIKRASIDMRGKTDKQDALRIAEYACRYQDRAVIYEPDSELVSALKRQVKIRQTLTDKKVAIENQLREARSHDKDLFKALQESYKPVLRSIKTAIKKADSRIKELSKRDEQIYTNQKLLKSIPGIGDQVSIQFIASTNNFKNFSSPKHMACYAGVVPFENESGTIKRKPKVSKKADLKLKSLLQLAAMAAIRSKGELRDYYIRKTAEGKNKMSVLNAIRNKLVHRMFAVVQRQTPYLPAEIFSIKNEKYTCSLT